MQDTNAFYERLKVSLDEVSTWPSLYLFKFIIPYQAPKIATVEAAFALDEVKIKKRLSKNGNYISLSIYATMSSSEKVIDKYKKVSTVEGIISL